MALMGLMGEAVVIAVAGALLGLLLNIHVAVWRVVLVALPVTWGLTP